MEGCGAGAEGWAREDQGDGPSLARVQSSLWELLPSPAAAVASVGGANKLLIITWSGHTHHGWVSGGESRQMAVINNAASFLCFLFCWSEHDQHLFMSFSQTSTITTADESELISGISEAHLEKFPAHHVPAADSVSLYALHSQSNQFYFSPVTGVLFLEKEQIWCVHGQKYQRGPVLCPYT